MASKWQVLSSLLTARLSQRIQLWVFVSILTIEAIVLIPSVIRRERELLNQLQALATAKASGLLGTTLEASQPVPERELLQRLRMLQKQDAVVGGILYRSDGSLADQFGEPPTLSFEQATRDPNANVIERAQSRYDAAWSMSPIADQYLLIIRHDTQAVQTEIWRYIGRIALLVLVISAFVTGAAMVVLYFIVIRPVLRLRDDLLMAGAAVAQDQQTAATPTFASLDSDRQDELGEVITAFGQMYQQISSEIAQRQESEQRFRALVEQAVDAFFVVDSDGQIIDVNQQACTNLNYSREALLALNVLDIQQELSASEFSSLWQQMQPGVPVAIDGAHRRRDGSTFPVDVRLGLFEFGNQQLILALVRDVTERKEAEKIMARLAEIGELAAMIVHEVRNPLTTVLMGLNAFKRLDLSERFRMRLELALEEAERLQRLLNEILLYAKQQKLELTPLDLNQLVTDTQASVEAIPTAADRRVKVTLASTPVSVEGDRDKLKQVLINLLSNACEAVSPGDVIDCLVTVLSEPQQVLVRVHNGGDPIPADVLPKLTQPFFTTKSTGNGLGLAITKRIVEAHGGTLTIESSAPEGTTVTVTLPLISAPSL